MGRILLAAHGTRSVSGRGVVAELRDALATATGADVVLGWVDVCEPFVADVVQPGDVVLPCFLGDGYHVRVDIPRAVKNVPQVRVTPHLGPHPFVLDALDQRVRAAGGPWPLTLLGWAGSSDERSRTQAEQAAAELAERWGVTVQTTTPKQAPQLVARAREEGQECGVATYLLAPGFFADRLADAGAPSSRPLGAHPSVVRALIARLAVIG